MLTTSDSILQFLKPHISKSKTCLKNLVKKLSDGTLNLSKSKLEVFINWIPKKCLKKQKRSLHHTTSSSPTIPWQVLCILKPLNVFEILPGGGGGGGGGMVQNSFCTLRHFFWYSIQEYFQFNFAKFQGAIWKVFPQDFQNRSYFLKYVVVRIAKLSQKLSTYLSFCVKLGGKFEL